MAYCAHCGKEISSSARACPQCGHPTGGVVVAPGVQPARPVEGFAIASLVCAIAGITFVPVIGGILGVVFAHVARRKLRENPGREGDGMATAGMIIGWVGIALGIIGIVAFIALFETFERTVDLRWY